MLSYFGTALTKLQDLGTFADRRPAEMAVLYVSGALLVVWVATTLYLATKRAIAQVSHHTPHMPCPFGETSSRSH